MFSSPRLSGLKPFDCPQLPRLRLERLSPVTVQRRVNNEPLSDHHGHDDDDVGDHHAPGVGDQGRWGTVRGDPDPDVQGHRLQLHPAAQRVQPRVPR